MITTIKSVLEGIGSGNGAWPTFGILSAVLNLAIGGTTAFVLGSICGIAFLLISIPMAYKSYHNLKKQKQELEKKKEKYENQLSDNLTTLLAMMKQYEKLKTEIDLTDFLEMKALELEQEDRNKDKLFARFLRYLNSLAIHNTYTQLEPKLLREYINQFLINELNIKSYSAEENEKVNEAALHSFFGTFGTIAGGSAGVVGMLVGLGLMASLSVMPWVGIAILITATVAAIYMADLAARNTELNMSKAFWCKEAKNLNNSTYGLNFELEALIKPSQIIDKELASNRSSRPNATYLDSTLLTPQTIITESESRQKIDTQPILDKKSLNFPDELKSQPTLKQGSSKVSSYFTYPGTLFNHNNAVKQANSEIEFLSKERGLQQY
ncbi:hypothetical protein ACQUW5_08825 [Legionella sp. CNM-1927-20]|uniref:hypothetical protein n=1 Tax=Legionella sp. CNM-1927-20 TaxID=3422221 RepID=UPI00403AFD69